MQIAQGMFEDQKEDAIAADMGISPYTVNTYVQRLYRKLDVCSRAQLIVRLMAAHLALSTEDSATLGIRARLKPWPETTSRRA